MGDRRLRRRRRAQRRRSRTAGDQEFLNSLRQSCSGSHPGRPPQEARWNLDVIAEFEQWIIELRAAGLTFREIGERVEVPESTVYKRYRRLLASTALTRLPVS